MRRHVQEKHPELLREYLERFLESWDASSESDRVKWMENGKMVGGQDDPQNFFIADTFAFL